MISKDQKENIICTMDGVRGDVLWSPHHTKSVVAITNKPKDQLSFKRSRENWGENEGDPIMNGRFYIS